MCLPLLMIKFLKKLWCSLSFHRQQEAKKIHDELMESKRKQAEYKLAQKKLAVENREASLHKRVEKAKSDLIKVSNNYFIHLMPSNNNICHVFATLLQKKFASYMLKYFHQQQFFTPSIPSDL